MQLGALKQELAGLSVAAGDGDANHANDANVAIDAIDAMWTSSSAGQPAVWALDPPRPRRREVVALVLLTLSGAVGGSLALRQRVIQLYLARRLLGEEADRLLAQPQPDWPKALPEAFSGKQLDQQSSVSPATRLRQVPPLAMPAVPSGWGFDEED